jgi:hypothetical protein
MLMAIPTWKVNAKMPTIDMLNAVTIPTVLNTSRPTIVDYLWFAFFEHFYA